MRDRLRKYVLDPLVRKIASRLGHFESQRSVTNDGAKWSAVMTCGQGTLFYEEANVVNLSEHSSIALGPFCCIRGELSVIDPRGSIRMGSHCFLGPGSRIWSSVGVSIGDGVMISHLVDIHDSNAHSLDWRHRRDEAIERFEFNRHAISDGVLAAPIVIGDHAWIGFKASILKGVTIGKGAVIAAGAVVTKDVPAFTVVAGNPARVVRELPGE